MLNCVHQPYDKQVQLSADISLEKERSQKNSSGLYKSFSLTFVLEFNYDNDEIYIAYSLPYTYTELQKFLKRVCNTSGPSGKVVRRQLLCRTLAGNRADLLIISSPIKEREGRPRRDSAPGHVGRCPLQRRSNPPNGGHARRPSSGGPAAPVRRSPALYDAGMWTN